MSLTLTSPAFMENIPERFTCEGENISPPLRWQDSPEGTRSYALVVDDPDSQKKPFTHWLIYNIPGNSHELPESVPTDGKLPGGAVQGENDFGNIGYGGPCPPRGASHRYRFHLYALDEELDLSAGTSKTQLLASMADHILDQSEVTVPFHRRGG